MKTILKNYTFSTSAKTVTLTDISTVRLDRLALIVDTTTNKILYNFADNSVATATVATNVVTLSALQGGESNSDKLQVIYDTLPTDTAFGDTTNATQILSSALPTGAATSAKQPALGTAGTPSSDVITVQGRSGMTALTVDGSGSTQPVSASSLPLPSGASTAAKQPALGTAGTPSTDVLTVQGATSMTAIKTDGSATTQPVSGNVTVSQATAANLKVDLSGTAANATAIKVDNSAVTQPVSGTVTSNIGTTNGLALDATLTGGTAQTKVTDGTNVVGVIKSDGTSAAGNAISTGYTGYTQSFTTTVAATTTAVDMTNYASLSVHITSQGTSSTITPQWSNDNTNWVGGTFQSLSSTTTAVSNSTSTNNLIMYTSKQGRYFRLNITGISAGTTAGNIHFSTSPVAYQTMAIQTYAGQSSNTANITSASSTLTSTSSSGYQYGIVTLTGTYAGIQFGITVSQDGGTTYYNAPFIDLTNGRYYKPGTTVAPADNSTNAYQIQLPPSSAIIRVVSSAWTSGTGAIRFSYSAMPATPLFQQPQVVTHTALPTAATTPNSTPSLGDKFGRQVVIPGTVRDLVGTQTTTIAASTAETTVVTAAASTFNDLTAITVANTSTTPARVDFRNTTAGSVIFSLYVPGSDVRGITFQRPVPQASVNTNWTAQSATSVTDLRVFAVYDKNA